MLFLLTTLTFFLNAHAQIPKPDKKEHLQKESSQQKTVRFLNQDLKFIKMANVSPHEVKALHVYEGKGTLEDKYIILAAGVDSGVVGEFKKYIDTWVAEKKKRYIHPNTYKMANVLSMAAMTDKPTAVVEHTIGDAGRFLYCINRFEGRMTKLDKSKSMVLSVDYCWAIVPDSRNQNIPKLIEQGRQKRSEIIKELEKLPFPVTLIEADGKQFGEH